MILRGLMAAALMWGSVEAVASAVGEEAHYSLDRSRARTSSLVRAGLVDLKVSEAIDDALQGPLYKMHYLYDLQIAFMGRRVSEGDVSFPQRYFEESFIDELKEMGEIATSDFKIKYLGSEDVTTGNGVHYPSADMVLLYDINLEHPGEITDFVRGLLGGKTSLVGPGGFEDVKIKAAIKHASIPVIGAASIDISGVRQGMPVKVGFDYVADAGNVEP